MEGRHTTEPAQSSSLKRIDSDEALEEKQVTRGSISRSFQTTLNSPFPTLFSLNYIDLFQGKNTDKKDDSDNREQKLSLSGQRIPATLQLDDEMPLAHPITSSASIALVEDKEDRNSPELEDEFEAYTTVSFPSRRRATFLNGRYTVTNKGGNSVVVLDSEAELSKDEFSEVDYISDLAVTRISVSKRKPWIAFSHHESNIVSIYKYNVKGKLKPLFFWEAQKEYVGAVAFLDNGYLATGGGGELYCTDNRINIWNIEKTVCPASFSKAKVPLRYSLESKEVKGRIEDLLALPGNQLCSLHATSFWYSFFLDSNTAILWNLKERDPNIISENTTSIICYIDGILVLRDTASKVHDIDIRSFYLYPDSLLTEEPLKLCFMKGVRSVLERRNSSSQVLLDGLLERNVPLTLEEIEKVRGKFKKHLDAIKAVMAVFSIATMIVGSVAPGIATSAVSGAIIDLIEKVKKYLDDINAAKKRIHAEEALAALYDHIEIVIRIQHWIKNQYSLSPEKLNKNFENAFKGNLEDFIHYGSQHFYWRYENQVALLDEFDAQRLGREIGEHAAEPFMMGLKNWNNDFSSLEKVIQQVINWLYYAAHLPFLMKPGEPMPVFSTSEGDTVSLAEILAPTGFEVKDEQGKIVQIEVESITRDLTRSLQRHVGGDKEPTVPASTSKSYYCRATWQDIAQLQYQAKEIQEEQKQDLSPSSKRKNKKVKLSTKSGFFSKNSLPFMIKAEEAKKVTASLREVPREIEDNDVTKLKKEKDAEMAALKKENVELRAGMSALKREKDADITKMDEQIAALTKSLDALESKAEPRRRHSFSLSAPFTVFKPQLLKRSSSFTEGLSTKLRENTLRS